MAGKDQQGGEVKLSCRNLWKIYGERPGSFLASLGSGAVDAAALATTVRATGHIAAVCDVSFDVLAGEIFVIMGLSSSGKSTVVRCLSRLVEHLAGGVVLDGQDLNSASAAELIPLERKSVV